MEKAVGVGVYEKPRVSRGGAKLHIIQLGGMGKCISSPSRVWNEIKMTKNCRVTERFLLCGALGNDPSHPCLKPALLCGQCQ